MGNFVLALTQPTWGSASLTEIIWTVIGFIGCMLTGAVLIEEIRDYQVAKQDTSFRRKLLITQAKFNIIQESLRLAKMVIVALIGVFALYEPPAVTTNSHVHPLTLVITIGLVLIVLLTVAQSDLDLKLRKRIREQVKEIDAQRKR